MPARQGLMRPSYCGQQDHSIDCGREPVRPVAEPHPVEGQHQRIFVPLEATFLCRTGGSLEQWRIACGRVPSSPVVIGPMSGRSLAAEGAKLT